MILFVGKLLMIVKQQKNDLRSKKRRTNEHMEIEDRLESLILRVGEKSTSSLESNLEGLASVLEADLSTYKSKILKILVECAMKLPDKCTIYTTLIGLLNTKNYNFGGECVELLVKSTKVCVKKKYYRTHIRILKKWKYSPWILFYILDNYHSLILSLEFVFI